MHSQATREKILGLIDAGIADGAIAVRLDVPRTTVRDIRRGRSEIASRPVCPRCWRPGRRMEFRFEDYAELLGLYLGDGWISRAGRSFRLRISLDAAYPRIIRETRALLARCFPSNSVGLGRADGGATAVLSVYSSHLPCLFPQHGAGKKHERRIELEPWQRDFVKAAPWAFLRGCIRSDGCVFINRTGPYRYLTYDFRNSSADIRTLFAEVCDLVGVMYRDHSERIRINRRASVELLAAHVGLKQ